MERATKFSQLPINEMEQWEQDNNAVLFFEDEKGIAVQKANDDEDNPVIIIMHGDTSRNNAIVLIDEQVKRLNKFLKQV